MSDAVSNIILAATHNALRLQPGIPDTLHDPDVDDDEFVPPWDPGALRIELQTPPGTEEQASQHSATIRERLRNLKRVVLMGEPRAGNFVVVFGD